MKASVVGKPPGLTLSSRHRGSSALRRRRRLRQNPGEDEERDAELALKGNAPGASESMNSSQGGSAVQPPNGQSNLVYTRSRGWFRPPWRRQEIPPPPPLPPPGAEVVFAENPAYVDEDEWFEAQRPRPSRPGFFRRLARGVIAPVAPPRENDGIMGHTGDSAPPLPPRSETMEQLMEAIAQQQALQAQGAFQDAHPLDPDTFVENSAPMAIQFTNTPSMPPPSPPIAGSLMDGSFRVDNEHDDEGEGIMADMLEAHGVAGVAPGNIHLFELNLPQDTNGVEKSSGLHLLSIPPTRPVIRRGLWLSMSSNGDRLMDSDMWSLSSDEDSDGESSVATMSTSGTSVGYHRRENSVVSVSTVGTTRRRFIREYSIDSTTSVADKEEEEEFVREPGKRTFVEVGIRTNYKLKKG